MWNSAAAWFWVHRLCVTALLLHDARPYGPELFSQVAWVHPGGGTYGREVLLIVKKEFFGYAAIA
jgi:hypothetical protein